MERLPLKNGLPGGDTYRLVLACPPAFAAVPARPFSSGPFPFVLCAPDGVVRPQPERPQVQGRDRPDDVHDAHLLTAPGEDVGQHDKGAQEREDQ